MVYLYKKSDIKKEDPVELKDAVQYKTLWNKADKLMSEIMNISNTLMFECETEDTKRSLYEAHDKIREFQHNLKVKKCYCSGDSEIW